MTLRVFFHVQHLLGIGHLRRAAAIARAMVEAGLEVTIASGGEPVDEIPLAGRLVQLPPARAADEAFSAILDAGGRPIDADWRRQRRDLLLAAFAASGADLVLVELFPFGRRAFGFELLPLLEAAAAARPRPAVVSSVRDILVAKKDVKRRRETLALVRRFFDRVLVHGDANLVPFGASFPEADEIADAITYTGYVVEASPPAADDAAAGSGEVLVSAGGGSVGLPLFEAALAARPLSAAADLPWRLITGPNLPQAAAAALAATGGAVVERFRADFRILLANCRLSVSQAGYNTVMEIVALGRRAVLVPFAAGQEMEQTLRARLLAERGAVQLVEAAELSPAALARAIDRALDRPPATVPIAFDGAGATAAIVCDLAGEAAAGRLADRT